MVVVVVVVSTVIQVQQVVEQAVARAAVTWSIHSKSETFLESTELAVRASVLGDLTVVVLGTEERRTCAGLQTAQVEFLPTHTTHLFVLTTKNAKFPAVFHITFEHLFVLETTALSYSLKG